MNTNETFSLCPEDKQRLLESVAEADRGEFVDAEQLLAELEAEKRGPTEHQVQVAQPNRRS